LCPSGIEPLLGDAISEADRSSILSSSSVNFARKAVFSVMGWDFFGVDILSLAIFEDEPVTNTRLASNWVTNRRLILQQSPLTRINRSGSFYLRHLGEIKTWRVIRIAATIFTCVLESYTHHPELLKASTC